MEGTARPGSRFAFARRQLLAFACLALSAAFARAQCQLEAGGTAGIPGANGDVLDLMSWDPDGPGPRPSVVVAGGSFSMFGPRPCSGIATFDPVSGAVGALGGPSTRRVKALAVAANGNLLAASRIGTTEVVEAWDGVQWTVFGPPMSLLGATTTCLATAANGDVYVGGTYLASSGLSLGFVLQGNGGAWQAIGTDLDAVVLDLAVLGNGDLIAGGGFRSAGGVLTNGLARFAQGAWSAFGQLDFGVLDLLVASNGDLVVGGTFRNVGGGPGVGLARFDGTTWTAISVSAAVQAIAEAPNGDLVVVGEFVSPAVRVGRWDGANWTSLGAPLVGLPNQVAVGSDGSILAAGTLVSANSQAVVRVALHKQGNWGPITPGFAGSVHAVAAHPDGGFVLSYVPNGSPLGSGGRLARFDGTTSQPFGSVDVLLAPPFVVMANGDLVGREFSSNWVRVTTTSITPLPTPPVAVLDIEVDAQQRVVVCGYDPGFLSSSVQRLDPSGWTRLGPALPGTLSALATDANGDLVVGGTFPDVGGAPIARVARWTGSAFAPLGLGVDGPVSDLVEAPDGRLLVLGTFFTAGGLAANGVAYWDGVQWAREPGLENRVLSRPHFLPDGSLVHRPFSGSQHWDGTQWHDLDDSLVFLDANYGGTAVSTSGAYVVAGLYYGVPQNASYPVLVYRSTCAATAVAVGNGCNGASLRVTNGAWVGGVCRLRGEGLGAAQVALLVTGLQPTSLALASLLPQGVVGCTLQVVEDQALTRIAFASGGVAQDALAIPRDPVFVGLSFRQQMVPVEFDAQGGLVAVTSTNAIDHVVGSY